jgi:hypothetical protein
VKNRMRFSRKGGVRETKCGSRTFAGPVANHLGTTHEYSQQEVQR